MGREAVSMETKVAAVLARVAGRHLTVTAVCGELQISRESYYKYRRRFEAEGPTGLRPRSRRPKTTPTATGEVMVQLICRARVLLLEEGWDNGATSIYFRLRRDGHRPPTIRTIHRILVRVGLVEPQPGKRPRSSYRRFEFPATDDCWQIDAFEYALADGTTVVVFEINDDRSRYLVEVRGWQDETTLGAWSCLATAIGRYGKPLMVLSDNSLAFTSRLHAYQHGLVLFEKNLIRLGIQPIWASPKHPQTCGKNERGHQTAQRWLTARPAAADLAELQQLLDRYRDAFNDRPHQALSGATPLEQRAASTRVPPRPSTTVTAPTVVSQPTATCRGRIGVAGVKVGLGIEYAGQQLTCFTTDDHVLVFYRHHLVHEFDVDRNRNYQQPLRSRGGPRRQLPD